MKLNTSLPFAFLLLAQVSQAAGLSAICGTPQINSKNQIYVETQTSCVDYVQDDESGMFVPPEEMCLQVITAHEIKVPRYSMDISVRSLVPQRAVYCFIGKYDGSSLTLERLVLPQNLP